MRLPVALLSCLLALPAFAQDKAAADKPQSDDDQALYLLGASLGQRAQEFNLAPKDLKWVKAGLEDLIAGKTLRVDPEQVNPKLMKMREARMGQRASKEKAKGKEYAEKAAKESGAQKFPSGLVMVPMKEGSGDSPKATDKVKVHYHGTFIDGKVFDSSVERKEPAEFPLNGVIPCWTEGVQKIKKGGKAKLVCPSDIAYGDGGRPSIPGGSTLVFEVELLDILK